MNAELHHSHNLTELVRVWRGRLTGTFHLHMGGGWRDAMVDVRSGGVLRPAELPKLLRAADRGQVRFELATQARAGSRPGSRSGLGGVVLELARMIVDSQPSVVPGDAMVTLKVPGEVAYEIMEACLADRLARRPVAVDALIRNGSATVLDLRALELLGLVGLGGDAMERARALQSNAPSSPPPEPDEEVYDIVVDSPPPVKHAAPKPPDWLLDLDDELDDDALDEDDSGLGEGVLLLDEAPAHEPDAHDFSAAADDLRAGEIEDADEVFAFDADDGSADEEDDAVFALGGDDVSDDDDDDADEDLAMIAGSDDDMAILAESDDDDVTDWTDDTDPSNLGVLVEPDDVSMFSLDADRINAMIEGTLGPGDEASAEGVGDVDTEDEGVFSANDAHDEVTAPHTDTDLGLAWDEEVAEMAPLPAAEDTEDEVTDDLSARSTQGFVDFGEPTLAVAASEDDSLPTALGGLLQASDLGIDDEIIAELQADLLNRARAELAEGFAEEAGRTLQRCDALSPGNPLVTVHIAWARFLSGEAFYASYQAELAVADAPEDPVVRRLAEALATRSGSSLRG